MILFKIYNHAVILSSVLLILSATAPAESDKKCTAGNEKKKTPFYININYSDNGIAKFTIYNNCFEGKESFLLVKNLSNSIIKWHFNEFNEVTKFDTRIYRNKHYLHIDIEAQLVLDFDNDVVFTKSEYVNGYSRYEIIEICLEH